MDPHEGPEEPDRHSEHLQTVIFDSNEAGILHQHLRADSHEVKAAVLAY